MVILGLFIIGSILYLYNQLFYIAFDEEGQELLELMWRVQIFFTIIALTIVFQ